ncbi:MAG: rod shape-determining protein MreD [Fibrobacter sp.]|nr:rod shape-determining protein MreD [Fibrobacter sp.]
MNNLNGLKILILFLLAFGLQVSVASWLSIFGISPDLVIIFVVTVSIKFGPAAGCFWGFMAGFTQDVYQPIEWLGANTIALTILGFVVGQLEEKLLTLNTPAKVGVLALGFFVTDMIYYGITGLSRDIITNLFLTKSVPECAYTLFIGSIVFYLDRGKKKRHA